MNHLVVYPGGGDTSSYHHVDSLDEAVAFVETLRNSDGIEECKIYELNQINYEVRAYYNVIVPGSSAGVADDVVAAEVAAIEVTDLADAELEPIGSASVFASPFEVDDEVDQNQVEVDEFEADAVIAEPVETASVASAPEAHDEHHEVHHETEGEPVGVPTETVRRGLFGR